MPSVNHIRAILSRDTDSRVRQDFHLVERLDREHNL